MRSSLLGATAALLLLGGCDPSPHSGGGICAGAAVCMSGSRFQPATLTIAPGATVVWRNADGVSHTVTTSANGTITETFDSGNVGSGGEFRFTFNALGTVRYYCKHHGADGAPPNGLPIGMWGTIIVKQ